MPKSQVWKYLSYDSMLCATFVSYAVCPVCGVNFHKRVIGGNRRITCSNKCRVRKFRLSKQMPVV